MKEAALRQLDNPNDGDPIMELSQETYRYDATRDWAFSKQTLEVVDNRAQVQVALRQPMGALREISYQLYNGSEILPSAFEVRNDQLCVARQLAELLQLPLPEVLSDFDAICDKGWEQRGIGDPGVLRLARRPHVLRQLPRRAPGRLPAPGQGEPGRGLHVLPGARLLLQVGPGGLPLRRHPAQRGPLPRRPEGNHGAALLRVAPLGRPRRVGPLLGRGPAQRPRRAAGPGPPAQGHHALLLVRLAGPAPPRPGRPRLRRHAVPRGRRNPPGLDAEAGPGVPRPAPVVPVHQALEGQPQVLQALCLECHRTKTLLESSRAACLESRVCRSVHEAYVQSPRPPALVCKLAKCDPDRICHGVDVVRCRKNALANATFPLPVFSPWTPWSPPGTGTWRASPTWSCTGTTGRPCSETSPTWVGTASPQPRTCCRATWADFKWSLDATAHVEPRCLAQALEVMEDAWPEGEEHMAKLSVNALIGLWARNQDLVYSMRTSNHELDGQGCQWRQTFTDAAGKVHWDHIYATELFSNYTLRPLHDYVMAQEHVAVAKIRDHLRKVPPRYVVALKTDCLVFQDLPKKFLPAARELTTARKHQDGTPVYRFGECKRLEGEYREPRIEAPYLTCYGPEEWRSVEDPSCTA